MARAPPSATRAPPGIAGGPPPAAGCHLAGEGLPHSSVRAHTSGPGRLPRPQLPGLSSNAGHPVTRGRTRAGALGPGPLLPRSPPPRCSVPARPLPPCALEGGAGASQVGRGLPRPVGAGGMGRSRSPSVVPIAALPHVSCVILGRVQTSLSRSYLVLNTGRRVPPGCRG